MEPHGLAAYKLQVYLSPYTTLTKLPPLSKEELVNLQQQVGHGNDQILLGRNYKYSMSQQ